MEQIFPDERPVSGPPLKIMVLDDRRALTVSWQGGVTHCLSAAVLRRNCRSSGAVRARIDGADAEIPGDITIMDARLVGTYALNLVFSDGEHRGIYPWAWLREIATNEKCPMASNC
ncbi:MAG: DUF971 domain-containing protein [Alphaproteobacteria bacterium]